MVNSKNTLGFQYPGYTLDYPEYSYVINMYNSEFHHWSNVWMKLYFRCFIIDLKKNLHLQKNYFSGVKFTESSCFPHTYLWKVIHYEESDYFPGTYIPKVKTNFANISAKLRTIWTVKYICIIRIHCIFYVTYLIEKPEILWIFINCLLLSDSI